MWKGDHLNNVGWASLKEQTLPKTSLRDRLGRKGNKNDGGPTSLSLFYNPFLDHICSVARVMNLSLAWNDATNTGKLKLIYERMFCERNKPELLVWISLKNKERG